MFHQNPDIKHAFISYCYKNLNVLSSKLVHQYLLSTTLPALLEERKKETNNDGMSLGDLLRENNLSSLHVNTVGNWLRILGFKYCTRKTHYYNDKHKSKENITYCMEFIKHYFEYKRKQLHSNKREVSNFYMKEGGLIHPWIWKNTLYLVHVMYMETDK